MVPHAGSSNVAAVLQVCGEPVHAPAWLLLDWNKCSDIRCEGLGTASHVHVSAARTGNTLQSWCVSITRHMSMAQCYYLCCTHMWPASILQ